MSFAADSPQPRFDPQIDPTAAPVPSPLATHRDPPPDISHDVPADLPPLVPVKRTRLASLDVFRGLTIAMMVLVNNNGNDHQYRPLEHAEWHGWTPTDLVFPFFLFIVGVAIPFSLSKRGENASRGQLLGGIWLRALALIMLGFCTRAIFVTAPWVNVPADGFHFTKAMRWFGFVFAYAGTFALLVPWRSRKFAAILTIGIAIIYLVYCVAMHFVRVKALANGWPEATFGGNIFNPDMLRIPGVLQRIGLCYGVAATIALFAGWRTVLVSALALCTLYTVLMFKVKVGDHELGSLTEKDNFARTVDVAVFDRFTTDAAGKKVYTQHHTYSNYPDNEGLISTLPAIATSLCGILAGFWLRTPRTAVERCAGLLAMAGPVIFLGIVLDHALMPINKNLWTPSFVVFCSGMAMLVLGTVFWLCDVLGRRVWAWPFTVMGMNAIAAFVASSMVLAVSRLFSVHDRHMNWKTGEMIDETSTPSTWLNHHSVDLLHRTGHWLEAHAPSLPPIATIQNESLIYALAFVLVIFLLMWLLYVCRIFVKV